MSAGLMPGHARELEESVISPEVAEARGYETLYGTDEDRRRLKDIRIPRWAWRDDLAFPALLIPMYRVSGEEIGFQFKPAIPQEAPSGKKQKYASQAGVPNRLDVPRPVSDAVRDPSTPLWITEGVKKADCLASMDLPVITLTGVFNWRSKLGTLGDWEYIPLAGRTVVICFDSDTSDKRTVMLAMQRLGRWLESKQAAVRYLIVPKSAGRPGGPETAVKGVDDYFYAGGDKDGLRDAMVAQLPVDGAKDAAFSDAVLADTVCSEELDGRFRWSAGLGWVYWTGKVWKDATDATVTEAVRLWALQQFNETLDRQKADANRDMRSQIDGWRSVLSAGRLGALVRLARGVLECHASDFDADPDLLNCPNGVVDLRTGVLTPHDPDLLMTKIAGVDFVKDASHPDWTKALRALPDDTVDWFQLRVGQAATGHMTPDDLAVICEGGGENGKSTVYDAVALAIGKYHVQVSDRAMLGGASDNHPTEIMDFMGARYAVLEETPEARRLDTNRLKKLIGTREITGRRIRQDPVTFTATHSLFVNTNYKPVVDETDHGTWRRLALLRWPYTFRKSADLVKGPNDRLGDPTLRDRIKNNPQVLEAALAWVAAGARRWYEADRIMPPVPARVEADTMAWRKTADLILAYLGDRLEFDRGSHVLAREVFEDFNAYITEKGQNKWSDKTFVSRFGGHDLMGQNAVERKKIKKRDGLSRPPLTESQASRIYYAWLGLKFNSGEIPGEDCTDCPDDPFGPSGGGGGSEPPEGPQTPSPGAPEGGNPADDLDSDSIMEMGKFQFQGSDQDQVPSVPSPGKTEIFPYTRAVFPADGTDGTGQLSTYNEDHREEGNPMDDLEIDWAADPFAGEPAQPAPQEAPLREENVPEIDTSGPIGFDLETADASEEFTYGKEFVRLAGVIDQHGTTRTGIDPEELVEMIGRAPVVYGHNALGFDGLALAHWHGMDWESYASKVVDTEPLARQAHPPRSRGKSSIDDYDLDHVAQRYGVAGKTDDIKVLARRHGGYDKIPKDDPEYHAYLNGDLVAGKAVYEVLPTDEYTAREHRVLDLMGRMTLNGFRVDTELLQQRLAEGAERKRSALEELGDRFGLPLGREVKRGRGAARKTVWEPHSSPLATTEGIAWLTRLWASHGVVRPPRTAKGRLSTAAEVMDTVAANPKCPPDLRDALALMRVVTTTRTVYQTAATYLTPQGRVHPKVSMRQASGRGSVTEPGMTVFGKRDGKHVERDIFIADEGHVIITCDLSQVDMRAVAGHCQDPLYMALYGPGKDAHQEIADMMGVSRDAAKPLGHGYNYGMGPRTMTEKEGHAPDLVKRFFEVMSQFTVKDTWTSKVRDIAGRGEMLDNGFGRLMRCDPQYAYTVAPALMGQGTARDITCEVLLRLMDRHPEYRPYLRTWVHDEFVFSVPEDRAEEIGAEIKDAFTWEWHRVPIFADLSRTGRSWGEVSGK